ncbi:hypothetical protein KFE80_06090 [bacterium SCSIO 12696]|nr:hypothetical protein KFE80_06090 [bacterium SCSIO 12696]
MKKVIFFVLFSILSFPVLSDTNDCKGLYVGKIWIEKGEGLMGVIFHNHPNNTSGSYWVYFSGWSEEEKKTALSLLTTAKIAKHRVEVVTEEADGCSIQTGQRQVKKLYLAANP